MWKTGVSPSSGAIEGNFCNSGIRDSTAPFRQHQDWHVVEMDNLVHVVNGTQHPQYFYYNFLYYIS